MLKTTLYLTAMMMLLMSAACKSKPAAPTYQELSRVEFNQRALLRNLPLYWAEDDNQVLEPNELVELWTPYGQTTKWLQEGQFTADFATTYTSLLTPQNADTPNSATLTPAELERRKHVAKELAQGRPTLLKTDFSDASASDRSIVKHVLAAAALIEQIYAKQLGTEKWLQNGPQDEPSRALFLRNQGPWCQAPLTEALPNCSALPELPKRVSGLYPKNLQENPKFCEVLASRPDGEELLHQFHVVIEEEGQLKAVPYHVAYQTEMQAISSELEQAAAAITDDGEAAFRNYLRAAAQAFRNDEWVGADEAWAKMNVHNSKWYLRIAPDEVYFEPCSRKAGFHVSFARINQDSLRWQQILTPVRQDMEKALAELAGSPYKEREVSFHLPDFIDMILNAGDSRKPLSATIGQSLPNWGPVANEGRGRTVAMTNLYTDTDSLNTLRDQAASLLCADTMARYTPSGDNMLTVLHEAAHNLGPAHEYKVDDKTASQIFGGPLASMLEELKAQTAANFFASWLANKGLIPKKEAEDALVRGVVWGFGHIAQGMFDPENKPKAYSQLAAIQLGHLLQTNGAHWRADALAANQTDKGCLSIQLEQAPESFAALMRTVAGIKGRGDIKAAQALLDQFITTESEFSTLRKTIQDRWLRAPRASFVYAIKY